MSYDKGDLVTFSVNFTVSGSYVSPTYVDLNVLAPSGESFLYQSTPTGSALTLVSAGKFQKDFFVKEEGQYWWRWFGSGTAYGADENFFMVDDSTF